MVLLTNAHGMNLVDPERDTISTTSFMSSSDQAYAVTEETQEQGSYTYSGCSCQPRRFESTRVNREQTYCDLGGQPDRPVDHRYIPAA